MTYEYKSVTIQGHPDETLNKLSTEGWELVTVDHSTYLLKRDRSGTFQ
jgi:hypothetical protein